MTRTATTALLFALAVGASAQNVFWSGDTSDDPTWWRPSSLSTLSGIATDVKYEVQAFWVDTSGSYIFEVDGGTHPDTYIFYYEGSFDPEDQLTNLKDGDDDFDGVFTLLGGVGQGFASSRIAPGEGDNYAGGSGLVLTANTQYYAVVTAFGNADAGTYDAAIGGGPGRAHLGAVPEPATIAALGLGAAALLARRRRRA